jgi:hypothetical protein
MKALCQLNPPRGERIAKAYCFRARCYVVDILMAKPRGSFVSHGKDITVAEDVHIACRVSLPSFPAGCECDTDVELVLLEECPVECERTVTYEDLDE